MYMIRGSDTGYILAGHTRLPHYIYITKYERVGKMVQPEEANFDLDHYDVDRAYNHVFNHLGMMIERRMKKRDNRQYELVYCEAVDDDGVWSLRSILPDHKLNAPGFRKVISLMYWRPNVDNAGATLREIILKILTHWRNRAAESTTSDDPDSSDKKETLRWTPGTG